MEANEGCFWNRPFWVACACRPYSGDVESQIREWKLTTRVTRQQLQLSTEQTLQDIWDILPRREKWGGKIYGGPMSIAPQDL